MEEKYNPPEKREEKPSNQEERFMDSSTGRPYTEPELKAMARKSLAILNKEADLAELEALGAKSKREFGESLEERMKTYLEGVEYLNKKQEEFQSTKGKAEEVLRERDAIIEGAKTQAADITYKVQNWVTQQQAKIAEQWKKAKSGDFIETLQTIAMIVYNCGDEIIRPHMKGLLLDKVNSMLRPRNIHAKIDDSGKLYYEALGGV